jgi:hypothetical protein
MINQKLFIFILYYSDDIILNQSSSKEVENETEEKTINQKIKRSLEEDLNAPNEQLKRSTSSAQALDLGYVEKPESLAEPLEKKLDTINLKAFFAERQGERGENLFISIPENPVFGIDFINLKFFFTF